MSDYLSTPPNSNVALYLSTKIASKDHTLDLDALPSEEENSHEAAAVAACLRGLGAFSEVLCTGVPQAVPFICYAMRFSETITHLHLTCHGGEIEELGRAMKANPRMPLTSLDLSGSTFKNINSVIWLAGGLRGLVGGGGRGRGGVVGGGLVNISFRGCGLTPKAVGFLVMRGLVGGGGGKGGMGGGGGVGGRLERLDMSGNEFRASGTKAICGMILGLGGRGCANIAQLRLNGMLFLILFYSYFALSHFFFFDRLCT